MTPAPRRRTAHLHGCTACNATYEDDCGEPDRDGRCNPCISGVPSAYAHGRRPVACCRTRTRPARKAEIKTYRLAGHRPWYLCADCHRTFVYDPRERP